MTDGGKKIMDGLRDAARGSFTAVEIDGHTWVRQPTEHVEAKLMAARGKISELYTERDGLQAAMLEARGLVAILAQGIDGPAKDQALRALSVLSKGLGFQGDVEGATEY